MSADPRPRLALAIDALVLEGLSPRDGEIFAAAFSRELTRLLQAGAPFGRLAGHGMSDTIALSELAGGAFAAPRGLAPDALGARAAAAVYRGFDGIRPNHGVHPDSASAASSPADRSRAADGGPAR